VEKKEMVNRRRERKVVDGKRRMHTFSFFSLLSPPAK
jgi:hypothetical protein